MNATFLVLMLAAAQPDPKSLQDDRARAAAAQAKLADLRNTMSKLLANVDALQVEIQNETAALEATRAAIAKKEKDLNDYILAEESRLIEIRKVIFNGKPLLKSPPKTKLPKDLYGDEAKAKIPAGKLDGKAVSWWTYDDAPKDYYLYEGEKLLGAWKMGAWHAASGGELRRTTIQAPVPLPKEQPAQAMK